VILTLKAQAVTVPATPRLVAYGVSIGERAKEVTWRLVDELRQQGVPAIPGSGDRGVKAQMRQANTLGARYALILGDSEVDAGTVVLKNLETSEQETLSQAEAVARLSGNDGRERVQA